MSSRRANSSTQSNGQNRSDLAATASSSTVTAAAAGDELSDVQVRVLYELNAIKAILDDVNASLHELVRSTSPGGRLYEAQQIALRSFGVWERLFVSAVAKP